MANFSNLKTSGDTATLVDEKSSGGEGFLINFKTADGTIALELVDDDEFLLLENGGALLLNTSSTNGANLTKHF